MGILTALGVVLPGSSVQRTLATSSEFTATVFSDNNVGTARAPIQITGDDIIDISPTGMIVMR